MNQDEAGEDRQCAVCLHRASGHYRDEVTKTEGGEVVEHRISHICIPCQREEGYPPHKFQPIIPRLEA